MRVPHPATAGSGWAVGAVPDGELTLRSGRPIVLVAVARDDFLDEHQERLSKCLVDAMSKAGVEYYGNGSAGQVESYPPRDDDVMNRVECRRRGISAHLDSPHGTRPHVAVPVDTVLRLVGP